jgi:hypothetical protein
MNAVDQRSMDLEAARHLQHIPARAGEGVAEFIVRERK